MSNYSMADKVWIGLAGLCLAWGLWAMGAERADRIAYRPATAPDAPVILWESPAVLVTLSADARRITLSLALSDTAQVCAEQPEGPPTCVSVLELRQRRD